MVDVAPPRRYVRDPCVQAGVGVLLDSERGRDGARFQGPAVPVLFSLLGDVRIHSRHGICSGVFVALLWLGAGGRGLLDTARAIRNMCHQAA